MGVVTNVVVRISPLPEIDDFYGIFFPSWECAVQAVQAMAGTDIPFSMVRLSNPIETKTNFALAGHKQQIALLA